MPQGALSCPPALLAMSAGGGGAMLSGAGQACLDALRCTAFLVQQHPEGLKEAVDTMGSSTMTGGDPGVLSWLEALVGALQNAVGGQLGARASSRRRRRKKRRRKGQAGEAKGHTGEEQFEEEEATASEDDEGEASGGAWRAEGLGGGQAGRAQQLQQDRASGKGQPTEEPGGMDVDPAASLSVPVRPRADISMSSSSSSSRRAGGAVRRAAVAEALSLADVVGSIFSFLVGVGEASTGRQSVRQLGQLGLVCRKWREVSLWEAWWAGAAEEVLPGVLWGRGEGGGGDGGRRRVLEHGRMSCCARRVWVGEDGWTTGVSIHFEVFDRMDGLQMLSARGALYPALDPSEQCMTLSIGRGRRWEVVGRPFCAASRDPEQRRFRNIRHFFESSHDEEYASSVCVRVSVTDERTGRRALLWEEKSRKEPFCEGIVEQHMQPWVGEGAFQVQGEMWQSLTCSAYSGARLRGYVGFVVQPVAGQAEGVSEQERLWQLAGADEQNYDEHGSFIQLVVKMVDGQFTPLSMDGAARRFVRSVLDVSGI